MTSSVNQIDQGIAISGNLIYGNITDLLNQANQYIEQNSDSSNDDFIIDCQDMQRLDSAGIALLLEWHKRISLKDKKCRFLSLSNQAKSLIKAYRLQSLIAA